MKPSFAHSLFNFCFIDEITKWHFILLFPLNFISKVRLWRRWNEEYLFCFLYYFMKYAKILIANCTPLSNHCFLFLDSRYFFFVSQGKVEYDGDTMQWYNVCRKSETVLMLCNVCMQAFVATCVCPTHLHIWLILHNANKVIHPLPLPPSLPLSPHSFHHSPLPLSHIDLSTHCLYSFHRKEILKNINMQINWNCRTIEIINYAWLWIEVIIKPCEGWEPLTTKTCSKLERDR